MDANRSSANAAKRVRIRRSCVGVTGYHQRRWRTPFQLRGYHFTGTPSSSTFARPNGVLLVSRVRDSWEISGDVLKDLVGGLGPHKRARLLVPGVDPGLDRGGELTPP